MMKEKSNLIVVCICILILLVLMGVIVYNMLDIKKQREKTTLENNVVENIIENVNTNAVEQNEMLENNELENKTTNSIENT